MRNLKKLVAFIVTIAMIATFAIPAFAVEAQTDAEICTDLGVLQGDGSGVTAEYLAKGTTRLQSAILYLRLLGLEDEALAETGTETFADADLVDWAGGKAILAYLKANPELGWVGDGTNFDPLSATTAQMLYKVMLTALGYAQGTDFEYADTITFADGKGLNSKADDTEISNDDTAAILVEALKAETTVAGTTLVEKLVVDGIVTEAAAQAAGLVEVELVVDSVTATNLKEVTVVFNKAVEDTSAVSFKIKKAAAIYASTVVWNEAKDTAVLTAIINLPAADYNVEITGIASAIVTKTVTFTDETVTGLSITSTQVAIANGEKITFKVSNQYGNDMTTAVTHNALGAVSVYNVTQGKAIATGNTAAESTIALTDIAANAAVGDVLRVIISYKGFTAQANITVIEVAKADAIQLDGIVLATDDLRLNVADATVELAYTITDQFGNPFTLGASRANAAAILTLDKVQFITSDAAVISGFSTNADGKLILTVAGAGTATITAIISSAGNVASTNVTVEANETASSAVITAPSALVAGGDEPFELAYTVTDQYGGAVTTTAGLTATIDLALATVAVTDIDTLTVSVKPSTVAATTAVTIKVLNGATEIGSLTFNVEPNAVVSYIDSITFGTKFEVNAVATITADDIVAIDQYGRTISAAGFTVAADDGADADFALAGAAFTAGAAAGSEAFTVTLAGKTKALALDAIATADVKTYALNAIDTIFKSANVAYHATPVLVGKTEAGATVHLVANKITSLTSSNTAVAKITGGKVEGVAAGTATISAWNLGTKLASVTVTVSDAASAPASIEYTATTLDLSNADTIDEILLIKDQYGVDITAAAFAAAQKITSDVAKVNAAGAAAGVGTATVVVVTDNGLEVSAVITVVP